MGPLTVLLHPRWTGALRFTTSSQAPPATGEGSPASFAATLAFWRQSPRCGARAVEEAADDPLLLGDRESIHGGNVQEQGRDVEFLRGVQPGAVDPLAQVPARVAGARDLRRSCLREPSFAPLQVEGRPALRRPIKLDRGPELSIVVRLRALEHRPSPLLEPEGTPAVDPQGDHGRHPLAQLIERDLELARGALEGHRQDAPADLEVSPGPAAEAGARPERARRWGSAGRPGTARSR